VGSYFGNPDKEIPEKEYLKLREKFYEERNSGATFIEHSQPKTRKLLGIGGTSSDAPPEPKVVMKSKSSFAKPLRGTVIINSTICPQDLIQQYVRARKHIIKLQ